MGRRSGDGRERETEKKRGGMKGGEELREPLTNTKQQHKTEASNSQTSRIPCVRVWKKALILFLTVYRVLSGSILSLDNSCAKCHATEDEEDHRKFNYSEFGAKIWAVERWTWLGNALFYSGLVMAGDDDDKWREREREH